MSLVFTELTHLQMVFLSFVPWKDPLLPNTVFDLSNCGRGEFKFCTTFLTFCDLTFSIANGIPGALTRGVEVLFPRFKDFTLSISSLPIVFERVSFDRIESLWKLSLKINKYYKK